MYRPKHVAIALVVFVMSGVSILKLHHKSNNMEDITTCLYESELLGQIANNNDLQSPDVLAKAFSDNQISTCTSIYTGEREVVKFGDDIKIAGYPNLVHQFQAKKLYQTLLLHPGVKFPQSFDAWWNNIPLTIKH